MSFTWHQESMFTEHDNRLPRHIYGLDPMHILLEGVIPVEIGCVLHALCSLKKYFTVTELNTRVSWFWSWINTDKRNKPPELSSLEPGHRVKPSMKAVQCWSLLRYLPLIVGDLVPSDDQHWLFLLHLCHLVDILFAPVFTVGMVEYLHELIAEHLIPWKSCLVTYVSLSQNTISWFTSLLLRQYSILRHASWSSDQNVMPVLWAHKFVFLRDVQIQCTVSEMCATHLDTDTSSLHCTLICLVVTSEILSRCRHSLLFLYSHCLV